MANECGRQYRRILYPFTAAVLMHANTAHTALFEQADSISQNLQGLQKRLSDQRHKSIKLQLTSRCCHCYCRVIGNDPHSNKPDQLRHDRIDFARYDRGTCLHSRQFQLSQASRRTAC
ncbi:hypothetical protein D3C71_1863520 [compost metagenome]